MLTYCFKCKKKKSKTKKTPDYLGLKRHKLKMVEQCYYQNVLYVTKKMKIYERIRSKRNIK